MKIVIKVGTQSILSDSGQPQLSILHELVKQIVSLQQAGHHVILVSSGAVCSGRKLMCDFLKKDKLNSIGQKQLLASVGQPELMRLYAGLFKSHQCMVSQLLLSKYDFQSRQHYLNISRLLHELLKYTDIIPIINENDTVAIDELVFTDNDELAGLIAAQINADKLILLTNVDGVYTAHPSDPEAKLISIIDPNENWPTVSGSKSSLGRGGMLSKLNTAKKMAGLGIPTAIANITLPSVITEIMENKPVGTSVLAHKKKSNIKRWIAFNSDKKMGSISINKNLYQLLMDNKHVLSLLPVGIEAFTGEFQKGDLIEIKNPDQQEIGIGIARYDWKRLSEYLGKKNKPAFIHYDHLHLF